MMTKTYISSHYNHFFSVNNFEYILFNAHSLSRMELNQEHYLLVKGILETPNLCDNSNELKNRLIELGFLIPADCNEKKVISQRLWDARKSQKFMSLTIAPTMGCNFNCSYCFEDEKVRSDYTFMSSDTQSKLVEFVTKHVELYGTQRLDVTWFGGEPLLALTVIKNLSENMLSLCEKNNINYSASIVTNGYKLDKETVVILKKLKITEAQVTIDGPEVIHDNRRVLKGGLGSFKKIITNLATVSNKIAIVLRVNVDKQNYRYLEKMVTEVTQHIPKNNLKIYLAPVHVDPNSNHVYQPGLSQKFFSEVDEKFLMHGAKEGINFGKKPKLISNACGADQEYSYMIGPHGELYHCWEDFGNNALKVGSLSDGRGLNIDYINLYYNFDPTIHEKCGDCTVLPLCMGGCPKRRIQHNGIPQCGIYKTNLREHLLASYNKLENNPENITDNTQQNVINSIVHNYNLFHLAEKNNFVFLLINNQYIKSEYLDRIAKTTTPLNKINLILLKLCYKLMNYSVTDDLKSWAENIKNKTNLKSIPYIKKVVTHLENHVLHQSIFDFLNSHHQNIINQCISIPREISDIIRLNVYIPDTTVNSALEELFSLLSIDNPLRNLIERVEISQLGLNESQNRETYPRIIVYFESEINNIPKPELINIIKSLSQIFNKFVDLTQVKCNGNFSWEISAGLTLTHGYKLYKELLTSLGLIDKIYSSSSNYAFVRENTAKWVNLN
ncbi:MAG: SPASM domain-containing protein [Gammaproteobacteria bacterium]